jgi:hypothetical protein
VSLALNILQTVQWIDADSGEDFCSVCTEFVLIVSSSEYCAQTHEGYPIPHIENCVNDDVHVALPRSITGSQKFLLGPPPRRNGTFLVEFAKIPLYKRLHGREPVHMLRDIVPDHKRHIQHLSIVNLALSILHTAEPLTLTGFIPLFGGGSQI